MDYLIKSAQIPIQNLKIKKKRNLVSKKQTSKIRLKALNVKVLANPPKNLDFKFAYKLPGDIYIDDHVPIDKKFLGLLNKLNSFKKIMNVYHDQENKLIGCHFIDCDTYSPPLELLVYRLQTLGNAQAYILSTTIEKILNKIRGLKHLKRNSSYQKLFEKDSYQSFLKKSQELISKFTHKYPIIMCRGSNFENLLAHSVFQMSFNYNFLSIIGEEINYFPLKLLKKGLPDCLWLERNYFEALNEILDHLFFPSQKEVALQYLIRNNEGKELKSVPRSHIITFEEDLFTEICLLEVYEIDKKDQILIKSDSDKNKSNLQKETSNFDKFDSLNLILDKNRLQESSLKWINNYYPKFNITFIEELELEKKKMRCGFKDF